MAIVSGRLKEIAKIQRPVRTPDGAGGHLTVFEDVLSPMYCDVRQHTPSTDVIASQANIIQPFSFITRYRTDIPFEIGDRIVWRNRFFSILGFKWDINRTELIISATTDNESTSNGQGT